MQYAGPPMKKGAMPLPKKKGPAMKAPPVKAKGVAKTLGSQFMIAGGC